MPKLEKTKKCIYCGSPSIDSDCPKCKIVKKAQKNGGNARKSRVEVATKHLKENPGLLKDMYCL